MPFEDTGTNCEHSVSVIPFVGNLSTRHCVASTASHATFPYYHPLFAAQDRPKTTLCVQERACGSVRFIRVSRTEPLPQPSSRDTQLDGGRRLQPGTPLPRTAPEAQQGTGCWFPLVVPRLLTLQHRLPYSSGLPFLSWNSLSRFPRCNFTRLCLFRSCLEGPPAAAGAK